MRKNAPTPTPTPRGLELFFLISFFGAAKLPKKQRKPRSSKSTIAPEFQGFRRRTTFRRATKISGLDKRFSGKTLKPETGGLVAFYSEKRHVTKRQNHKFRRFRQYIFFCQRQNVFVSRQTNLQKSYHFRNKTSLN
jgi:hypothetical protein